jgi:Kdo2-lipid IVA lauroyltransferase/acyltransferase
MYRPANNALVDYWVTRWRSLRSGREALPKDDLKKLVRVLRKGEAVWYAPDQTLRQPNAVFLPMFGMPTLSITATSRLAEMGRARVVPFFTRIEGGRYIVEIQPALEGFPSADERADTLRVLALIEAAARRSLAEYFWIHRRFKERPEGTPDPYQAP